MNLKEHEQEQKQERKGPKARLLLLLLLSILLSGFMESFELQFWTRVGTMNSQRFMGRNRLEFPQKLFCRFEPRNPGEGAQVWKLAIRPNAAKPQPNE